MKVVFMGTPDFSVGSLQALCKAGYEVTGVVTQPDKPKGRGKSLSYTPVKEAALTLGLPVFQPQKVSDSEFLEVLKGLEPEVIVVVAFGQILPQSILKLTPLGCINVHASLLPKYRGAAPIQQAVIDGEKVSGVTIMRMNEGLDTGDMIARVEVSLAADETGGSLFDKLSEAGAKLLTETLPSIVNGSAVYEKQPQESPTPYAAMITKQQGLIDWNKDAASIERLVRGLNPWPSAYTYLKGKTLKVWHCRLEEEGQKADIQPGAVLGQNKAGLLVQTGDGVLCLEELQLEGKKRMAAEAFLRGYQIEDGTVLSGEREQK